MRIAEDEDEDEDEGAGADVLLAAGGGVGGGGLPRGGDAAPAGPCAPLVGGEAARLAAAAAAVCVLGGDAGASFPLPL